MQQLLLVPVFLSQWGAEYYGAWLVLTAIPTMLSMSNLGLGTAASTRIVLAIGKGDEEEANAILCTSIATLFGIFSFIILAICFLPLLFTNGAGSGLIQSPEIVLALLMSGIGLSIAVQPLEAYWVARHKAATAIFVRIGLTLLQFLTTFTIVLSGGRAHQVAMGIMIATVSWLLVYGSLSLRLIDWHHPLRWKFSLLKGLLGKGIGFQASALWQAILFQGSIVLANSLLGPIGAATWGSVRMLTRTGTQLIEVVKQALYPEIQNSVAKSEWHAVRKIHATGVTAAFCIGLIGMIGLLSIGPWFYSIWTNGELSVSRSVWFLLGLALILNSIWWASEPIHRATNQPWGMNLVGVTAALSALGVMWVLGRSTLEIHGFAVGAVVFEVIMAGFVLKRSLEITNDKLAWALLRAYSLAKQQMTAFSRIPLKGLKNRRAV